MAKSSGITALSVEVGDILFGRYKKERLSQETLAERTGMSPVTLQKKIAGRAPITATDLVLIAGAIPTDPGDVLNEAIANLGGIERLMSEGRGTTNDIDEQKKKRAAAMTPEELEAVEKSAATRDAELLEDEPPTS